MTKVFYIDDQSDYRMMLYGYSWPQEFQQMHESGFTTLTVVRSSGTFVATS